MESFTVTKNLRRSLALGVILITLLTGAPAEIRVIGVGFDRLAPASALAADPQETAAPPEAAGAATGRGVLEALSFLVGRWEGEGWIRRGPGEPSSFRGSESVEPRLDGRILIIEGKHVSPETAQVVHQAFGVISADADSTYTFRAYTLDGRVGDFPARIQEGALVWEMPGPPGSIIRYTIRVVDEKWEETGEMVRDGRAAQFFAMSLKRVP